MYSSKCFQPNTRAKIKEFDTFSLKECIRIYQAITEKISILVDFTTRMSNSEEIE